MACATAGIGTTVMKLRRQYSSVTSTYLEKRPMSSGLYSTTSSLSIHESMTGFQPTSSALTKMTPPRETVAGEQWTMWLISSSRRIEGVSGMRSLEASVSILLSSITVFIDSIHSASMSPSSTIHWCLLVVVLAKSRKVTDISPSFHSRVVGCRKPYSSLRVTDLGLIGLVTVFSLKLFCARESVFQMPVLPQPAGPSRKTDQRTASSSRSCEILSRNMSSGW